MSRVPPLADPSWVLVLAAAAVVVLLAAALLVVTLRHRSETAAARRELVNAQHALATLSTEVDHLRALLEASPLHASRPAGTGAGVKAWHATETGQARHAIHDWVVAAAQLLPAIERALREYEHTRHEADRARRDLEQLREELNRFRDENERLLQERTEITQVLGKLNDVLLPPRR